MMTPRRLRIPWFAAAVCCCAAASGCFDAESLTQAKLKEAARLRLEDVDLGKYRITLPRRPGANNGGVIQFHVFGQVANRDRKGVEKELRAETAEIRHHLLVAVRQLTPSDLIEPDLMALRNSIAAVMNSALEGDPVRGIGFYQLRFNTL